MINMGVVRECSSPYASPVVVVNKKDNTNRVCVNYRKLNKLYLIPSLCQLLNTCSGSLLETKLYSKIDLSKGYWQMLYQRRTCVCSTSWVVRVLEDAVWND